MAVAESALRALTLYRLRWIAGCKEGACWVRARSAEHAVSEFYRQLMPPGGALLVDPVEDPGE